MQGYAEDAEIPDYHLAELIWRNCPKKGLAARKP